MDKPDLHNERDLVLKVALGDEYAYKELFRYYWGRVYSIALHYAKVPEVAEDAAQEVFAQIWLKRGLLIDVEEFRAYLFAIARNLIYNKLRSTVFAGNYNDYLKEYFADASAGPEKLLELKETNQFFEDIISKLPPQQQKVFRLSRFGGLTHSQIAERTGLSKRTVKNYIVSAILFLRSRLDEHSGTVFILIWVLIDR